MSLKNSKPKVYSAFQVNAEFKDLLGQSCDLQVCKGPLSTHEELIEGVRGTTVIHCVGLNNVNKEVIEAAGQTLKAICTISAGYNHIHLETCKKRNIRVGYVGRLVAGCMAEFTVGIMISAGRRFKEAIAEVARGGWENWSNFYLNGHQLNGSNVGIVGLGFIGQEVAKRLKPFGVEKILYSGPRRKAEGDKLDLEYVSFDSLLRNSDFVVATCALNETTSGMFNKEAFGKMKPTSVFVNVTRGGVVNQDALYEALTTKKIFAAALDVTTPEPLPKDHPLVALENCLILPHIGSSTQAMRSRMAMVSAENVLAALLDKQLPSELKF